MSLNSALAVAGRSLEIFSTGVQVAGENIANASTPGYIREELILEPAGAFRRGQLIFGSGANAVGIQQRVDIYLETRLHAASTDAAAAGARQAIYHQLESEIRELGDADLSTGLNDFLGALNDVANQPESLAFREIAISQAEELAIDVRSLRVRIDSLREAQTVEINSLVVEANELIQQVASLNPRIAQLEASGALKSDAGAERSKRYEALSRLSEIIPVKFRENKDGTVDVFSGPEFLIIAGTFQQLETENRVDRGVTVPTVTLDRTRADITRFGGEIRGVSEGRDDVLGGFVDELDQFSAALIYEFNRLHASGDGLSGFTSVTASNQVSDATASLSNVGLPGPPENGQFEIRLTNTLTGLSETSVIDVDLDGLGADTSLNDLQAALDAVTNVSATINPLGQLQLDAANGFEIHFANDSSGALASLGINTVFTGVDSGTIGINAAVDGHPERLAVGLGGGPADGRNAAELLNFLENPVSSLADRSLDGFYDFMITNVAQDSAAETTLSDSLSTFRESLYSQRQQFSGVSLDEEAIRIIEFQRAFQSAARMITTIDELMQTLVNL